MAPDRVEEWFELRNPLASSSGSRRFGGSDVIDIAPGATEPMVAATSNRVLAEMEDTPLATSKPGYRLDSEKAKEYMKNIEQFRILVLGRANAGKTTILQRVCGSTELPEVFDEEGNKIHGVVVQGTSTRGYHSIKHQFMFQSNPGFVFHDSCGFEAGSTKQFDEMKNFVIERAVEKRLKKRIHAIWYCIPMTECNRTVTAAEKKFFNECDTGHVPVIVLLTKVDTLNLEAIQELENESLEIEVTDDRVEQKERELLEEWLACVKDGLDECEFPPRAYMALQSECSITLKKS
ncbi:hypothetical protein M404DRAFT_992198 [Pisolithus tinctorius Marx 270]|uniref:Uncharacterized protein n=1 Tax=Pisolithus tinctorius Marx 270 TaxID=870435 RepID=A0A0C3JXT6_PISTI|nr:hypothetical protein M404DRAFT_992198 [Pisolithus tinctorius Marx 270]